MNLLLASVFGLVVWIVLWAIGAKAMDAFLLTIVIFFIAASARAIASHRHSKRVRRTGPQ